MTNRHRPVAERDGMPSPKLLSRNQVYFGALSSTLLAGRLEGNGQNPQKIRLQATSNQGDYICVGSPRNGRRMAPVQTLVYLSHDVVLVWGWTNWVT